MVPAPPITSPAQAAPPGAAVLAAYLPRIIAIAAEHFGRDEDDLTAATTLGDLRADSLHRVELVCAAEEAFGVAISDEDAHALTHASTLADIAAIVAKAKAGAP